MDYCIVSNIGAPQKEFQRWEALLIGTGKITQWSKGTLIGVVLRTCIRTEKESRQSCRSKLSMEGSITKALQPPLNVLHGMPMLSSLQWDELRGTEHHAAFALRCTGIE